VGVGRIDPSYTFDVAGDIRATGMLVSQNIYSLGNVGIGTSNPTNKLEVNGSVRISSNLTAAVLEGGCISSSVSSTASNVAASSAAVKAAYDLANTANTLAEQSSQFVQFNSKHDYMISATTFTNWEFTNAINNEFISHDADVSTFVIKISGIYTFAASLICWAHVDTHEFRILRTSTVGANWNSKSSTIQYGMFPSITFFAYANDTINVQLRFPIGEGYIYSLAKLFVYKH
jgi:hypothetical protein